jgi:hypothetical protein
MKGRNAIQKYVCQPALMKGEKFLVRSNSPHPHMAGKKKKKEVTLWHKNNREW